VKLWERFKTGLTRTRERFGEQLGDLIHRRGPVDPETRDRLEDALLSGDVGPATAERLIERAEKRLRQSPDLDLRGALEQTAADLVGAKRATFAPNGARPWVALIVGVNGVGKTTLAGKLASGLAAQGHRPVLVAADTFRAAAVEQLDAWATRAGVELVRAGEHADPAAVVHDALSRAKAQGRDVVLIDTAGRLHTKHNLMAELEKVHRVCGRVLPGAPHHVLLVLDATLGQNSVQQAKEFQRALPITSLAITKLDGTARGGAVLAIADELALPISVVGLGESIDDWQPFDPEAFAKGLFEG
jgi:fused signal recognition particle receptor